MLLLLLSLSGGGGGVKRVGGDGHTVEQVSYTACRVLHLLTKSYMYLQAALAEWSLLLLYIPMSVGSNPEGVIFT